MNPGVNNNPGGGEYTHIPEGSGEIRRRRGMRPDNRVTRTRRGAGRGQQQWDGVGRRRRIIALCCAITTHGNLSGQGVRKEQLKLLRRRRTRPRLLLVDVVGRIPPIARFRHCEGARREQQEHDRARIADAPQGESNGMEERLPGMGGPNCRILLLPAAELHTSGRDDKLRRELALWYPTPPVRTRR